MSAHRTTRYEAQEPSAGMTPEEITAIMLDHPLARVRAEVGFGGWKPGGPIKAIIIEED